MLERKFSSQFRKEAVAVCDGNMVLLQDAPMSGKKPFDAFYLLLGMFVAIEFKVANGGTFPYSAVKPHQITSLRDVTAENHIAQVVVLFTKFKMVACIDYVAFSNHLHLPRHHKTSFSKDELVELSGDDRTGVTVMFREKVPHMDGTTKTAWNVAPWVKRLGMLHNDNLLPF